MWKGWDWIGLDWNEARIRALSIGQPPCVPFDDDQPHGNKQLMQRAPVTTDYARPSALPTASLRNVQQAEQDVNSETYLQQLEEDWNRKIDEQVEVLVNNMMNLVEMSKVSWPFVRPRDHA